MKKAVAFLLAFLFLLPSVSSAAYPDSETEAYALWKAQFIAAHPDAYAAFDPEAFLEVEFNKNPILRDYGAYYTKALYLSDYPLEPGETFEERMLDAWLYPLWREAEGRARVESTGYKDLDVPYWKMMGHISLDDCLYSGTIEEYGAMVTWMAEYWAAHPDFDADAYYMEHLTYPPGHDMRGNWFQYRSRRYGDEEFTLNITALWLEAQYRVRKNARDTATLAAQYPDEFAAFDADAWFSGYYGGLLGLTKEAYMTAERLPDEPSFRSAMFAEWAAGDRCRFGGYVVTVDGVPVQFQAYPPGIPYAEQNRLFVPVRALAETMHFEVEYSPADGTILCTRGNTSVLLALGSTTCIVTTDEGTRTVSLAAAPAAAENRTYLPLRSLAEAFGARVEWDQPFLTAALRTA